MKYHHVLQQTGGELIFSSNRLGNSDIYISSRKNRKWKDITAIEELNTEEDDVASSLAYDGQRILLFKFKRWAS